MYLNVQPKSKQENELQCISKTEPSLIGYLNKTELNEKCLEFNTILHDSKEEKSRGIFKYFKLNEYENTTHSNS